MPWKLCLQEQQYGIKLDTQICGSQLFPYSRQASSAKNFPPLLPAAVQVESLQHMFCRRKVVHSYCVKFEELPYWLSVLSKELATCNYPCMSSWDADHAQSAYHFPHFPVLACGSSCSESNHTQQTHYHLQCHHLELPGLAYSGWP